MNIVIAGASGFVGAALGRALLDAGHKVSGLGRSGSHPLEAHSAFVWHQADTTRPGDWQAAVSAADAVINLTGATIFKRWTRSYRRTIVDSRLKTTANLVAAMDAGGKVLLSTSAVGYYGSRGDEVLDEASSCGDDFLARLSVDWERAALAAEDQGNRVAVMRFGVVLGPGGGAMAQMLPAFRRFAGGPLGSGRQWFAWIHLDDLINAAITLLQDERAHGVYNFCSPVPIRQKDFASTLGRVVGRPALVPAPSPLLKLVLGDVAKVLLASQRVHPGRLLTAGFVFSFADLTRALTDIVERS